jgi:hypothetical protein
LGGGGKADMGLFDFSIAFVDKDPTLIGKSVISDLISNYIGLYSFSLLYVKRNIITE